MWSFSRFLQKSISVLTRSYQSMSPFSVSASIDYKPSNLAASFCREICHSQHPASITGSYRFMHTVSIKLWETTYCTSYVHKCAYEYRQNK